MGFLGLFGGSPKDKTEDILGRHLDSDFKVFPMADAATTDSQIESIGKRFGVVYPRELIAHLTGAFPGLYIEVKEAVWPRPKPNDVGPFWSFLYAIHTYTPAPDSEPWMRLSDAAEIFQKKTCLRAAPVLRRVGDKDLYCVDPKGKLVQFRHEENRLEPISLGFWQLLDREVGELADRNKRRKSSSPP